MSYFSLASPFATAVLGEVAVLQLFFTASEPKESLPDKASCCRTKLRLWDSEGSRAAKGPSAMKCCWHACCNPLHDTAAMPAVYEVVTGMLGQVRGSGWFKKLL